VTCSESPPAKCIYKVLYRKQIRHTLRRLLVSTAKQFLSFYHTKDANEGTLLTLRSCFPCVRQRTWRHRPASWNPSNPDIHNTIQIHAHNVQISQLLAPRHKQINSHVAMDDTVCFINCSVLQPSRSEGQPHHGRTFSIYLELAKAVWVHKQIHVYKC